MRISKVRGKESKRSIIDRRVNELNCIYGLAESIRAQDTLPEVFRDVPRLVESAWQHPEIIRCKVTFDGEQYIMKPFKETRRRESADILVWGEARGKVEVFYLEECSEIDEGSFIKDKRLLDAIASILGEAVERREVEVKKQQAESMLAALREGDSLKTKFISMASHELRTIMTSLCGFSELLLRRQNAPEETQRKWAEHIHQESWRLTGIVDDLLDFSRVQSGKMILKQEPLNLLSIVKDAIQSVTATREKHEVVIDIPKDLPAVSGDRGRLIQVLVNLLDNAIKYNPYGGKVNVIAHRDLVRDQVVVSVSDQGIGIAPEDQKKLFTTFHRIRRPETENSRGTGMGLYIVKALVELMGGEIWVKSELNKGSTFSFSVPTFNLA